MAMDKSSADFFEAKYRTKVDPWDFAKSPYEQSRYDAIMAALAHKRYERAFEPGCSIGVLTERLARIADEVEAIDFSPTAVERARDRCLELHGVQILGVSLSERLPIADFDLVVLCEVGYYYAAGEWSATAAALVAGMPAGGTLLASHWTGKSADHRISGDRVHEILNGQPDLVLEHSARHDRFRLDRWTRI